MTDLTSTLIKTLTAVVLVSLLSLEAKAADQPAQPVQLAAAGTVAKVDDAAAAAASQFAAGGAAELPAVVGDVYPAAVGCSAGVQAIAQAVGGPAVAAEHRVVAVGLIGDFDRG